METVVIIGILLLIIGGASFYLIRAKRRGVHCVGCPHGGKCAACQANQKPAADTQNKD